MPTTTAPIRVRRLALLLALLAAAATPVSAQGPPNGTQFDWDSSPDALVLRFEERSDKLVQAEGLELLVHGDGRVVARRPAHYRNGGDHEITLPAGQLRQLLEGVVLDRVMSFDPERVRQERRDELQRRRDAALDSGELPPLHYTSETERVTLELHLTRYRPKGEHGPAQRDVEVNVVWRGLRRDLRELPGTPALVALSAAADACRELLGRAELGGR